ncbi:MAG: hypothetical protein V1882_10055, partial [Candidatus Omnitrophota bacterium]
RKKKRTPKESLMRKHTITFFVFMLMFGGFTAPVHAGDCTKDNLVEKFGDWFGNIGKKEKAKTRNIAARRANKLAACAEKEAEKAAPKTAG